MVILTWQLLVEDTVYALVTTAVFALEGRIVRKCRSGPSGGFRIWKVVCLVRVGEEKCVDGRKPRIMKNMISIVYFYIEK